ncbi:hypothetical protein [Cyclobacterium sp.]
MRKDVARIKTVLNERSRAGINLFF